ncbi:MAG: hypothetical protein HY319_16245 [Armatimonadetes bacterium]|nr:hypothetical protein [Armatimonadota bacterium]
MNGITMGRSPRWLDNGASQAFLALVFALSILGSMALGLCGCTMFSIAAGGLVLACTLLVGNSAFGALTSEREKKTLDSLRLTQLTAAQVVLAKLSPEFALLSRLLLALAPTVLLASVLSGSGLALGLAAVGVAAVGGLMAAVFGIFVSSLFDTTSRAVVAGWIGKAVWLVLTPLLDSIAAAVLVSTSAPPLFSSLNPLAVLGVLLVPEAAEGLRAMLPALFVPAAFLVVLMMGLVAVRRFDTGLVSDGGLADRVVHPAYRKGWGPRWLQSLFPGLKSNPSFMRELALQVRSGAGRWPGYAVFIVLFLAPFVYAKSWGVQKHVQHSLDEGRPAVIVVEPNPAAQPDFRPSTTDVVLQARGVDLVLKGHTGHACMRLALHRMAGIPLPEDDLMMVTRREYQGVYSGTNVEVETPLDPYTRQSLGLQPVGARPGNISTLQRDRIHRSSMSLGIAGAMMLLLLYLSVRCSGFMATAITGEKDRRSWEDLALSGISPGAALSGKLLGALLLPLVQMTVAFPVLLFFVWNGSLGVFEVTGLYLLAVTLAVAAGMLGLWSSANSSTSHEAHARALCLVVLAFTVLPLMANSLGRLLAVFALVLAVSAMSAGRSSVSRAWSGMAAALLIAPQVASPVTALLAFSPTLSSSQVSFLAMLDGAPVEGFAAVLHLVAGLLFLGSAAWLLWTLALERLQHPAQGEALQAELAS